MAKNRRVGKKERKQKRTPSAEYFLIASEGSKTESQYFFHFTEKLIEERKQLTSKIELPLFDINGIGMIGKRLIEEAELYYRRNLKQYKYKWLVFDKDDFSAGDFNTLTEMANSRGFEVAWSNECFELWFILHFEYMNSGLTRDQYYQKLKDILKENTPLKMYSKTDTNLFEYTYKLTETAINNAKRLRESNQKQGYFNPADCNPQTQVDLLAEELLSLGI